MKLRNELAELFINRATGREAESEAYETEDFHNTLAQTFSTITPASELDEVQWRASFWNDAQLDKNLTAFHKPSRLPTLSEILESAQRQTDETGRLPSAEIWDPAQQKSLYNSAPISYEPLKNRNLSWGHINMAFAAGHYADTGPYKSLRQFFTALNIQPPNAISRPALEK